MHLELDTMRTHAIWPMLLLQASCVLVDNPLVDNPLESTPRAIQRRDDGDATTTDASEVDSVRPNRHSDRLNRLERSISL